MLENYSSFCHNDSPRPYNVPIQEGERYQESNGLLIFNIPPLPPCFKDGPDTSAVENFIGDAIRANPSAARSPNYYKAKQDVR